MKVRINKLISEALSCSRRDADEYIKASRVKINGKTANLSDCIENNDVVLFDQVDLPVSDLISQIIADNKQEEFEQKIEKRIKQKKEEKSNNQKNMTTWKSSKPNNDGGNKVKKMRNHSWDDDDDNSFSKNNRSKRFEPKGKKPFKNFRSGRYSDFGDEY